MKVREWLFGRPAWLRNNGSWFGSLPQWLTGMATAVAAFLIIDGYQAASAILENFNLKQNLEAETKRLSAFIEEQKAENGSLKQQNSSLVRSNGDLAAEQERITKSIERQRVENDELKQQKISLERINKDLEEQKLGHRRAQLALACAAGQSATIDMLNMAVNNRNFMVSYLPPPVLDVGQTPFTFLRSWENAYSRGSFRRPIFRNDSYLGSKVRFIAPSTLEVRVSAALTVFSEAAIGFQEWRDTNVLLSALQRVANSYSDNKKNLVILPKFDDVIRPTAVELIAATDNSRIASEIAGRLHRTCLEVSLDYRPEPVGMVFFDFEKLDLSSQARVTLREVASSFKDQGMKRMTVWAHTDTDEDPSLSISRAKGVRDALVSEGIPAYLIAAFGQGSVLQLVRTDKNVREPQNRRAEIMFW